MKKLTKKIIHCRDDSTIDKFASICGKTESSMSICLDQHDFKEIYHSGGSHRLCGLCIRDLNYIEKLTDKR